MVFRRFPSRFSESQTLLAIHHLVLVASAMGNVVGELHDVFADTGGGAVLFDAKGSYNLSTHEVEMEPAV